MTEGWANYSFRYVPGVCHSLTEDKERKPVNIPLVVQLQASGCTLKGSGLFKCSLSFPNRPPLRRTLLPFLVPVWVTVCVCGGQDGGCVRSHCYVCVCVYEREIQVERRRREREWEGILLFTPAVFHTAVTKQNPGISGQRVNTMTKPIFPVQKMSGLIPFKLRSQARVNRLIIGDLKYPYNCLQKATSLSFLTDEALLQTSTTLIKPRQLL